MKASSGISSNRNVRFNPGISASSGIESSTPPSFQAFYPFSFDFLDRVSSDYVAIFDNEPSFGGGGINTVANTDIRVTTFQDNGKGVYQDDGDAGAVVMLSDFGGGSFTLGVNTAGKQLFYGSSGTPATNNGKYFNLADVRMIGDIYRTQSTILEVTGIGVVQQIEYKIIKGTDAQIQSEYQHPNEFTIDRSFSAYFPDEAAVSTLRTNAGDDVSGFPAALPWDTSGDFKFGYMGIGKTVADITSQVLLQTGNMGITTGIGITFAEIGASISSLSVTSDTIVGECFIKYVSGMLSIVIDGVESTPVASAAPTIGAFAQIGANISNSLAAPGTYGELVFEVL